MTKFKKDKRCKIRRLTSFENDMLWMSIRYAIGRHSISCVSFPEDIYFNTYERLKLDSMNMGMLADEINRNIADELAFKSYKFLIDNSLRDGNKYLESPLYLFYDFLMKYNITSDNLQDLNKFSKIIVYKGIDGKIEYNITENTKKTNSYISYMDFSDLSNWQMLANIFDEEKYKECTVEYNEKKDIIKYIDVYKEIKVGKYEKCKFAIDRNNRFTVFLNEDYIIDDNINN